MGRIVARAKRVAVGALARPHIRQGVAPAAARLLTRERIRDRRSGEAPPEAAGSFTRAQFYDLYPLNRRRQWLINRVIARRVVPGLSELLEDAFCVLSKAQESRDGISVVRLREFPDDVRPDIAGLLELVRRHGAVRVAPLRWDRGYGVTLASDGPGISVDGRAVSRDELVESLLELTGRTRLVVLGISERAPLLPGDLAADDQVVRMYVGREEDDARVLDAEVLAGDALRAPDEDEERIVRPRAVLRRPAFFNLELARERFDSHVPIDERTGESPSGAVPHYAEAVAEIERVLGERSAPFSFISIDIAFGADGRFRIVDIAVNPVFPAGRAFSEAASAFLLGLWAEQAPARQLRAESAAVQRQLSRRIARARSRVRAFQMRAVGFTGPAAREWNRLRRRAMAADAPAREIRRALDWGFDAATIRRFGITPENRDAFLSAREYLYAQPLNGTYAKWIRDRVSALMVFHPFVGMFAPTHFQVYRRSRGVHFVPLSDEATSRGANLDAVAQVLQRHGELELRPTQWRDRVIARVAHDGAHFLVNGMACTPGEFYELLASFTRRSSLVVVEPRAAEDEAERETVSVTMLNAAGDDPRAVQVLRHVPAVLPGAAEGDERAVTLYALADPATGAYRGAKRVVDGELRAYEDHPGTGELIDGAIREWPRLLATLQEMGRFAPQLRFMQYRIELSDAGPEIRHIAEKPRLSEEFPLGQEAVAFVKAQGDEKRRRSAALGARIGKGAHNAKLKIRREFAKALYPQGLLPYQSVRWLGDMRRDLFQRNGVDLKTKLWAYRNGFLSYRIPQYGITPSNRLDFISDFEYRWLRHINTRYKYWLEDKISIKYVASAFNEFLPGYYYATSPSGGRSHLIPMMDCPDGYGARFEDVLRLAREKGVLALKPDEGSHGDGFYRLGWSEEEGFTLNGEPAGEDDVLAILRDPENRYLVTEFILMHPMLAEIYPNSVNTLRMTVFKRDGVTPQLGNAYLRVGSVASGFVDNTAAGGLLAEVDIASGRFGSAKSLRNGRVVETPNHPDTGVFIDGVIPNWEFVKEQVLKMAASFSQLEYLGFDVAITEDGFKIPEINRFPDFPRIDVLEPETVEYLLMKLGEKKRQFGYHRKRPRRLISLPRRGDV